MYRVEIRGNQFNKILESFPPCYSQFLLLASLIMNSVLYRTENEGRKLDKKQKKSEKTQVYAQKPRLKIPIKNFISVHTVCLIIFWVRSSRVVERRTVNAEVATVLGLIPASSDAVESEGQQMRQC